MFAWPLHVHIVNTLYIQFFIKHLTKWQWTVGVATLRANQVRAVSRRDLTHVRELAAAEPQQGPYRMEAEVIPNPSVAFPAACSVRPVDLR